MVQQSPPRAGAIYFRHAFRRSGRLLRALRALAVTEGYAPRTLPAGTVRRGVPPSPSGGRRGEGLCALIRSSKNFAKMLPFQRFLRAMMGLSYRLSGPEC